MPGIIQRLLSAVSPSAQTRAAPSARTVELAAALDSVRNRNGGRRASMRRFDGAVVDRLTASWLATGQTIDLELRSDLDRLRVRSRDLFKNNEYAKKFGRLVRNNVVGSEGFSLQVRAKGADGKLDSADSTAVETAFWRWCRPEHCDVTRQRSFADVCRSLMLGIARDGEYLVRKVRGGGEFGLRLQILDVNRLDTTFNREAVQGQNAVVMGVELDQYRAPVAYHILTSVNSLRRERERIPASEMLHGFMPIEDEQTRGVPWLHAAMRRLNDLNGYREAAVIAARIGASKMGFFVSPDGEPPTSDGQDSDGNFVTQAAPGEFEVVPTGYDFKSFDPAYPHDQFDAFCKAALRGIASAAGVSYPSLGNDLEGVNFSSIRAGVLEERDEWMVIQNWFITAFLVPIYEEWLEMALMRGAIRLPAGSPLPASKLGKYQEHQWQGRRWQWVDPLKDIEAAVTAIEHRLASPQQIAAQTGRDLEEVVTDISQFNELLAKHGVSPPPSTVKPATPAVPSVEGDE